MDQRIKKLWVDALRGGQYQQGRERLRTVTAVEQGALVTLAQPRDCCLGVLCDLYRIDTGQGEWLNDGTFTLGEDADDEQVVEGSSYPIAYDEDLPEAVCVWAGLSESNPTLTDSGGLRMAASEWNDGTLASPASEPPLPGREAVDFAKIADLIEASLYSDGERRNKG